jgi:hypothetical protein
MFGSFNEKATTLIELLKKADKNYLKSINDKAFEPDSEISHKIGDVKGSMQQ